LATKRARRYLPDRRLRGDGNLDQQTPAGRTWGPSAWTVFPKIVVRTGGTNGYVIVDAAKFVPPLPLDDRCRQHGRQAAASAGWLSSTFRPGYLGVDYLQDNNTGKGVNTMTYSPGVASGSYFRATHNSTGGANLATTCGRYLSGRWLGCDGGLEPAECGWSNLASQPGRGFQGRVRTGGTNGYVIVDAARFVAPGLEPISGRSDRD